MNASRETPSPSSRFSLNAFFRFVLGCLLASVVHTLPAAISYTGTVSAPTTLSPALGGSGTTFKSVGTKGQIFNVTFSTSGTRHRIERWEITGELPPGLSLANGVQTGPALNTVSESLLTFAGTPTKPGRYPLHISTHYSSRASSSCSIVINIKAPPRFKDHPLSRNLTSGQSATLKVSTTGYPAPTYQWYKNSQKLPDQTSAVLSFSKVTHKTAGAYYVVATNSSGSAKSSVAMLTVSSTKSEGPPGEIDITPPIDSLGPIPQTTPAIFWAGIPNQTYATPYAELAAYTGFTYAARSLPSWLHLDSLTGILSASPEATDIGYHTITLSTTRYSTTMDDSGAIIVATWRMSSPLEIIVK